MEEDEKPNRIFDDDMAETSKAKKVKYERVPKEKTEQERVPKVEIEEPKANILVI